MRGRWSLALAFLGLAAPAHAAPVGLDLQLGGGSIIAWGAPGETGNAFGASALLGLDDFSCGLGLALVMPDARMQGDFGAYWLEGRWYLLGRAALLTPYVVVGGGFTWGDGFERGAAGFVPARWSPELGLVAQAGGGVRFGSATGLTLGVDVRALNNTHLGIQLLAGWRLF